MGGSGPRRIRDNLRSEESQSRRVPKVGIEPTWGNPQRCLRPSRLPFRHFGVASDQYNRRRTCVKFFLSQPVVRMFDLNRLAWQTSTSIVVLAALLATMDTATRTAEARAGPNTTRLPCWLPRSHGDLPAFNQLVLHYQSLAYNIAYRLTGDETCLRMPRRTHLSRRSRG